MAAAMLVKKICIEMAANDAGLNTTGTISISSSFLMQQTEELKIQSLYCS